MQYDPRQIDPRQEGEERVYRHQPPLQEGVSPHQGRRSQVQRQRQAQARQKRRQRREVNSLPVPWWMWTGIAVSFVLAVGLFIAQYSMVNYLNQRTAERIAAQQAVLDSHPIAYQSLIEQEAAKNNIQPAFVCAIIMNESSFRTMVESSVGARGLMQLMPDTASWIAGKLGESGFTFERMYDAETNIRFGCWYIGFLSERFRGDIGAVAAAYHAGQGEVTNWLSNKEYSADGIKLDVENLMDGPTKNYAKRVNTSYGVYQRLYFDQHASAS